MSFTVAAEDVSVLHDPAEFYDTLHTAMQLARHRVSLSSLYIGNGPLEQRLLDTLRSKVCECARAVCGVRRCPGRRGWPSCTGNGMPQM